MSEKYTKFCYQNSGKDRENKNEHGSTTFGIDNWQNFPDILC